MFAPIVLGLLLDIISIELHIYKEFNWAVPHCEINNGLCILLCIIVCFLVQLICCDLKVSTQ